MRLTRKQGWLNVKFGIGLFSDKHTRTLAEYIRLADEHGFNYAWVSSQFFNRNVFVTLTYAATITERIKLGTGVVNPYFRHPSMLAQGAASLNEVSNGRAVLGIGSGMIEGPETSPAYPLEDRLRIGKPLRTTREAIEIVKRLLSGESLTYDGEVFRLREAKLNFPPMEIPVYVGARRRLMFRLAGELADGVLTHGIDEAYLRYVSSQIKKGTEKSRRSLEDIDIATWTYLSTSTDSERIKKVMRLYTAWLAESLPEGAVPDMDLGEDALERIRSIAGLVVRGRYEEAATLVDDKLIDAMHIFGDEEKCIGAVERMEKGGVTQVVVSAIDDEMKGVIEFVGKEIIPCFKCER